MDMKYGKSARFVAIATKSRGEANSRPRRSTAISEAHLQINLTASITIIGRAARPIAPGSARQCGKHAGRAVKVALFFQLAGAYLTDNRSVGSF